MADRLQVTKSWLSRYLELARLPAEILACFASPHVIGISHAAAIAPLLSHPQMRSRLMAEAASLADEQRAKREAGAAQLQPAPVVARLIQSGRPKAKAATREELFRDADGKIFLKVRREGRAGIVFTLPSAATADRQVVSETIERYLEDLAVRR